MSGAVTYEVRAYDEVGGHRSLSDVSAPMTTITDSNLETGRAYFYWVSAVNSDGGQGPWSARVDLVAGGAPDTPANLTGTAGYLENSLTWDAVASVDHYEVWGRLSTEANNYRELDLNQKGTSYTHPGLTSGQSWYYWVRAVDGNGTKGLYAGPEVLTVLAPPTVSAPALTAALGNTQVVLTWTATAPVTGITITGYEFRYRESGGTWEDWAPNAGDDLTETITDLTNGQAYDFEVRATTSVGAGGTASRTQTPATVPDAPTLTATGGYQRIDLSWEAPSDNGGAAISGYRIERENDDATWTARANPPASVTTWSDTSNLSNNISYTYRIFAINIVGESDWTSATAVTLAHAPQVPSAPESVGATAGPGSVTLEWTAPAFNGGVPIIDYEYRYKLTNGGSWINWRSIGIDETEVEITGLTPNSPYDFEVRAENSRGFSPSLAFNAIPAPTAPTRAPSTLDAELSDADDDGLDIDITLSWAVLTATDDRVNGGQDITGYEIEWKTSDGDDDSWAVLTGTTLGAAATEATHENGLSRDDLPISDPGDKRNRYRRPSLVGCRIRDCTSQRTGYAGRAYLPHPA